MAKRVKKRTSKKPVKKKAIKTKKVKPVKKIKKVKAVKKLKRVRPVKIKKAKKPSVVKRVSAKPKALTMEQMETRLENKIIHSKGVKKQNNHISTWLAIIVILIGAIALFFAVFLADFIFGIGIFANGNAVGNFFAAGSKAAMAS